MYRSDNDRSIKSEEHNLHKYNCKSYIADNRLQITDRSKLTNTFTGL